MKKFLRILVPVLMVLLTSLVFTGVAMADDPTVVTVTWNGAGGMGASVDTGDSNAGFNTSGSLINGSYTATDSNNNPYSYGIDNFSSYLNASVTDGHIQTGMARVNSYAGMYGPGGQLDTAFVGVNGGTASMAFRAVTNFAALGDGTYGYQLPGGHNIVANADAYTINRDILDGQGNWGSILAAGNGSAVLDCMSSGASGSGALELGRGQGCYTDANFNATGTGGTFQVAGHGNDSVVFNGLGIFSGGGTLSFVANWINNFSISDYSLTAH